ncbi:unnamed protein product [Paramecium octaurelia]|uniref:Uncharacterized protein n=1 Tax=Paramecium octaurelia TaxID=43137 RepID=A0A8S1THX6_PAROT|nr:unnamed protein product [Paramecium octaurelia]
MGATVCKQRQDNYGQEVIQDQNDVQINNITFAKEQSSKLDRSSLKHPSLKKKIITQILEKLPDDPINLSNNQSSIFQEEKQEPTTPALPTYDVVNQNGEKQHFQNIQLIMKEVVQSIKMNSTQKLVSSQQEEVLQQFKEQTSQYSRSCKVDNRQKLLNMNLVEDNFDDYIYYDWKNSNLQLISVNDQNLLKKLSSAKPMSKQAKKNG